MRTVARSIELDAPPPEVWRVLTDTAAHSDWSVPALWVFLASYLVFAAVTWWVYLRKGSVDQMGQSPV